MPMRIAKTTTRDEKELAKMEHMMDSMGASLWGVFQEGTEIEVVESTKGDAFNVYDKRVDRANSELSKLIIGQTMTIEDGSSLSQSQTHLEVFETRGKRPHHAGRHREQPAHPAHGEARLPGQGAAL